MRTTYVLDGGLSFAPKNDNMSQLKSFTCGSRRDDSQPPDVCNARARLAPCHALLREAQREIMPDAEHRNPTVIAKIRIRFFFSSCFLRTLSSPSGVGEVALQPDALALSIRKRFFTRLAPLTSQGQDDRVILATIFWECHQHHHPGLSKNAVLHPLPCNFVSMASHATLEPDIASSLSHLDL